MQVPLPAYVHTGDQHVTLPASCAAVGASDWAMAQAVTSCIQCSCAPNPSCILAPGLPPVWICCSIHQRAPSVSRCAAHNLLQYTTPAAASPTPPAFTQGKRSRSNCVHTHALAQQQQQPTHGLAQVLSEPHVASTVAGSFVTKSIRRSRGRHHTPHPHDSCVQSTAAGAAVQGNSSSGQVHDDRDSKVRESRWALGTYISRLFAEVNGNDTRWLQHWLQLVELYAPAMTFQDCQQAYIALRHCIKWHHQDVQYGAGIQQGCTLLELRLKQLLSQAATAPATVPRQPAGLAEAHADGGDCVLLDLELLSGFVSPVTLQFIRDEDVVNVLMSLLCTALCAPAPDNNSSSNAVADTTRPCCHLSMGRLQHLTHTVVMALQRHLVTNPWREADARMGITARSTETVKESAGAVHAHPHAVQLLRLACQLLSWQLQQPAALDLPSLARLLHRCKTVQEFTVSRAGCYQAPIASQRWDMASDELHVTRAQLLSVLQALNVKLQQGQGRPRQSAAHVHAVAGSIQASAAARQKESSDNGVVAACHDSSMETQVQMRSQDVEKCNEVILQPSLLHSLAVGLQYSAHQLRAGGRIEDDERQLLLWLISYCSRRLHKKHQAALITTLQQLEVEMTNPTSLPAPVATSSIAADGMSSTAAAVSDMGVSDMGVRAAADLSRTAVNTIATASSAAALDTAASTSTMATADTIATANAIATASRFTASAEHGLHAAPPAASLIAMDDSAVAAIVSDVAESQSRLSAPHPPTAAPVIAQSDGYTPATLTTDPVSPVGVALESLTATHRADLVLPVGVALQSITATGHESSGVALQSAVADDVIDLAVAQLTVPDITSHISQLSRGTVDPAAAHAVDDHSSTAASTTDLIAQGAEAPAIAAMSSTSQLQGSPPVQGAALPAVASAVQHRRGLSSAWDGDHKVLLETLHQQVSTRSRLSPEDAHQVSMTLTSLALAARHPEMVWMASQTQTAVIMTSKALQMVPSLRRGSQDHAEELLLSGGQLVLQLLQHQVPHTVAQLSTASCLLRFAHHICELYLQAQHMVPALQPNTPTAASKHDSVTSGGNLANINAATFKKGAASPRATVTSSAREAVNTMGNERDGAQVEDERMCRQVWVQCAQSLTRVESIITEALHACFQEAQLQSTAEHGKARMTGQQQQQATPSGAPAAEEGRHTRQRSKTTGGKHAAGTGRNARDRTALGVSEVVNMLKVVQVLGWQPDTAAMDAMLNACLCPVASTASKLTGSVESGSRVAVKTATSATSTAPAAGTRASPLRPYLLQLQDAPLSSQAVILLKLSELRYLPDEHWMQCWYAASLPHLTHMATGLTHDIKQRSPATAMLQVQCCLHMLSAIARSIQRLQLSSQQPPSSEWQAAFVAATAQCMSHLPPLMPQVRHRPPFRSHELNAWPPVLPHTAPSIGTGDKTDRSSAIAATSSAAVMLEDRLATSSSAVLPQGRLAMPSAAVASQGRSAGDARKWYAERAVRDIVQAVAELSVSQQPVESSSSHAVRSSGVNGSSGVNSCSGSGSNSSSSTEGPLASMVDNVDSHAVESHEQEEDLCIHMVDGLLSQYGGIDGPVPSSEDQPAHVQISDKLPPAFAATAGIVSHAGTRPSAAWLTAAETATHALMPYFTYGDLAGLLVSLIQDLGLRPSISWWAAVQQALPESRLAVVPSYAVVNVLRMMAMARYRPPNIWTWQVEKATLARLGVSFTQPQLASCMLSLCVLRVPLHPDWLGCWLAATRVSMHTWRAEMFIEVLCAALRADLPLPPDWLYALHDTLLGHSQARPAQSLPLKHACALMWAWGKLRWRMHPMLWTLLYDKAILPQLQVASWSHLANIIHATASSPDHPITQAQLHALLHHAMHLMQSSAGTVANSNITMGGIQQIPANGDVLQATSTGMSDAAASRVVGASPRAVVPSHALQAMVLILYGVSKMTHLQPPQGWYDAWLVAMTPHLAICSPVALRMTLKALYQLLDSCSAPQSIPSVGAEQGTAAGQDTAWALQLPDDQPDASDAVPLQDLMGQLLQQQEQLQLGQASTKTLPAAAAPPQQQQQQYSMGLKPEVLQAVLNSIAQHPLVTSRIYHNSYGIQARPPRQRENKRRKRERRRQKWHERQVQRIQQQRQKQHQQGDNISAAHGDRLASVGNGPDEQLQQQQQAGDQVQPALVHPVVGGGISTASTKTETDVSAPVGHRQEKQQQQVSDQMKPAMNNPVCGGSSTASTERAQHSSSSNAGMLLLPSKDMQHQASQAARQEQEVQQQSSSHPSAPTPAASLQPKHDLQSDVQPKHDMQSGVDPSSSKTSAVVVSTTLPVVLSRLVQPLTLLQPRLTRPDIGTGREGGPDSQRTAAALRPPPTRPAAESVVADGSTQLDPTRPMPAQTAQTTKAASQGEEPAAADKSKRAGRTPGEARRRARYRQVRKARRQMQTLVTAVQGVMHLAGHQSSRAGTVKQDNAGTN